MWGRMASCVPIANRRKTCGGYNLPTMQTDQLPKLALKKIGQCDISVAHYRRARCNQIRRATKGRENGPLRQRGLCKTFVHQFKLIAERVIPKPQANGKPQQGRRRPPSVEAAAHIFQSQVDSQAEAREEI